MNWPKIPLNKIAPAESSNLRFLPDEKVWHLTLDQIESNTGYILSKKIALASEAGTSTNKFDDGNVLYSKLRPYLNKVLCPKEPGIATSELVPLRPRKDLLDRKYLTYYLRSNHFLGFAKVAVAGVKMPRIIMSKFWKHRIPLPPLSEQRRIVEILDQADALRKKRAEADAKAARILPALFYKMFGDPATNPRNWDTKPLGKVCIEKPQYGANASASEWKKGMPRYVRITDIKEDGNLQKNSVVTLNLEDWEPYRLKPGDILFARSGNTVGKTYLYRENDGTCAFAGYLIRFQVNPELVIPRYLFALTQTNYYKNWVEARKRVAGQPNINGKEYSNLQIPCPPISRQRMFTRIAESLVSDINTLSDSKEHFDRLFENIVHRAFSGKLTAKWREQHIKELLQEMEMQSKALDPAKQINGGYKYAKKT